VAAVTTVADVRGLALALPDTSEKPCYGTPGFYVRKKLFARVKEDGESIVVKVDFGEREALVSEQPETFVVTDHYRNYPMVIVRLATVDPAELAELIEEAWRRSAPKRLLAAHDAGET
jgi:hypothetical protein